MRGGQFIEHTLCDGVSPCSEAIRAVADCCHRCYLRCHRHIGLPVITPFIAIKRVCAVREAGELAFVVTCNCHIVIAKRPELRKIKCLINAPRQVQFCIKPLSPLLQGLNAGRRTTVRQSTNLSYRSISSVTERGSVSSISASPRP